MAKTKKADPTEAAWSMIVHARLRKFQKTHARAVAKVKQLNEQHDSAMKAITDATTDKDRERLKAECWDIEQAIKDERAKIKWASSKVMETIDGADQGMLFEDDNPTPSRDGDAHLFEDADKQGGDEGSENFVPETAGAK